MAERTFEEWEFDELPDVIRMQLEKITTDFEFLGAKGDDECFFVLIRISKEASGRDEDEYQELKLSAKNGSVLDVKYLHPQDKNVAK